MVGGGEVGMEVPVVALAARMTCWAVGGRLSHLLVSLSYHHCKKYNFTYSVSLVFSLGMTVYSYIVIKQLD